MAQVKWLWPEGSPSTKRQWLSGVKAHWKPVSTELGKRLKGGELIVSAALLESYYTVLIRELSVLISMSEI